MSETLTQAGPGFRETFSQFLQPQSTEDIQDVFQQAYVDPAMQVYQQQILPAILQGYGFGDEGQSSALNQALAQSAKDLSTSLGSQFGQFYHGQQQNQLQALGQFAPLVTGRTFEPMIQQRQGILGSTIGALGTAAGGYFGRGR